MNQTGIEWTEYTWNPVTGCTPISEGCQNCYARRMAHRLRGRFGYPADDPFRVTLHPERLEELLRLRKPKRIFVCSMGDLFHADISGGPRQATVGFRLAIELLNGEEVIMREISDKKLTRDSIALTYAFLLRQAYKHSYDWKKINEAIIARWSRSGLEYIKRKAWKLVEEAGGDSDA